MARSELNLAPSAPDPIQFREYKLLLKAERFAGEDSFHEFWRLVHHTAKSLGLDSSKQSRARESRIREVLFYDTPSFDLYNHHFIIRKRTLYHHGWLEKEHRVAIKFRHPERALAEALTIRPAQALAYRIRFKEELLPQRDRIGGMRSIFSHACVLDSPGINWARPAGELQALLPVLANLPLDPRAPVDIVNQLAIEEIFEDIGEIQFGDKVAGAATVAVWRNRATQSPLVGEFAFQIQFTRLEDLPRRARELSENFYKAMQLEAYDWLHRANTKTALVYRLGGGVVTNDE
ncbi:MAG TPA: hypothetical protein VKV28_01380 [Candidatus Binataceae bacterium]|nr:hypothetical protein [Candidatus Binataceae bacterium]